MNTHHVDKRFLAWFLCLVSFFTVGALAEKTQPPADSADISKQQVQAKLDGLEGKQDLEEAEKKQLSTLYQAVLDNLDSIEKNRTKTAEFENDAKDAPEKIKKLEKEIEQGQQKLTKQKTEDFTRISNEELEQRLIFEKEKIATLSENIKKLDEDFAIQNERPQLIRQENVKAGQALEDAQKKLAKPAATTDSKLVAEASQMQLTTQADARNAELKMLAVEANTNAARAELLKTESLALNTQRDLLSPIVVAIENVVNERRQQEAIDMQQALSEAEKTLAGKHALIQQATKENIQYSRDLQAITGKIETYSAQKNKAEATAKSIEADFKNAEKKINLAGLSPVLGKILREQRRNLATQELTIGSDAETVQKQSAFASLEQFKVEDKLKAMADVDSYLKGLMNQFVEKDLPVNERMMIQAELRILLNNQKELLNKLSAAETVYLRTLGDFDFANQQMHAQASKYVGFLDEHLLWVKSSMPINKDYLQALTEAVLWLFSPFNWIALIQDTIRVALENPFLTLLSLLGTLFLPIAWRWAKQQLAAITEKIEKIYTDDFSYTLQALAYTLLLVMPLPVFLYILGWFLSGDYHSSDFSRAMGAGLQSIATVFFAFQLFYRLFSENGMAVRHFQWKPESAKLFHKEIAWIRFVIIPGVFLIGCTGATSIASHGDSLGRLASIMNMVALSVFFARLFHVDKGFFNDYLDSHPKNWFSKLNYLWYAVIVAIPLVIAAFAVAGYYLSALELQKNLVVTLRLIFVLVLVYGMVMRWLTHTNRKLALQNARQKRKAAAQTEKPAAAAEGVGGDDPTLPVDEQLIDIPTINAQTIKLLVMLIGFSLVVGFWMIWSNILPAFSFMENIVLWQHQVLVDNQETYQPVTLKNLLMACLYLFIVVVSVRNFPGVMELLLFSRISIAAGGRYAVNQLATYVIIAIGLIFIANELGGSWSQVQWLVAALSVGLGFGLQEIFANLVSGIILLFERPIRVGDTVTIGGVTGKVSRIQMRATTLIDPDQKELVVPNKTFITTQLVNWTLTDPTTRIVVPVSIAYGSDVEKAHKVMLDVVKATQQVLQEPPPGVVFTGFGAEAMEFSVRVYVGEVINRLPVTHNLHINLEKALRENGIHQPK